MKNLILSFFLYSLFSINAAAIESIWPNVPFAVGADFCNIKNDLNKNRGDSRREYIYDTLPLLDYGASGYEAYNLIIAFEQLYDQHQFEAQQKLQVSLEALLKTELSRYYNFYKPKNNKFVFRNSVEIQKLIQTAKSRANNGSSNSDIKKITEIPSVDYMAMGTFSMSASCNGEIDVTLDFIHLKTGDIVSFYASGTAYNAMNSIAGQIFELFQKTQFPSKIQGIDGSTLTILGTPTGRLTDKTDWNTANIACKSLKGRLPSVQEIKLIAMYGDYSDGITLQLHGNYCTQEKDSVYVSDFVGQEDQSFNLINDKTAFFFCVK